MQLWTLPVMIHNSSGQPVPVSHHPHHKKCLPPSQPKTTLFQFKTISPCPVIRGSGEKSLSIFVVSPLYITEGRKKVSPENFLLQAEPPQFSAFLQRRGVPSLWSFLWPSSGPAPTGPCVSCAGHPRAGCRTPGGVSQKQSRERESPLSTFWLRCFLCSPGGNWLSGLQVHIAVLCPICHPPVSSRSSLQLCSSLLHMFFDLPLSSSSLPNSPPTVP